jgi:hypothetical protein
MTICEKCGAEAVGGSPDCPRCGARLPADRAARGLAVASMVIGAACAISAFTQLLIDYASDRRYDSSLVSLISAIAFWLLVGFPMLSYRRPALFLPVMAATIVAYLWALERLTGGSGWFLSIALPIALAAMAAGGLTALACVKARRRGPNIASFILIGCTAVCAAIELILSLGSGGSPVVGWSAIVAAAALPTAFLLLGLHHRLRRREPGEARI